MKGITMRKGTLLAKSMNPYLAGKYSGFPYALFNVSCQKNTMPVRFEIALFRTDILNWTCARGSDEEP